MIIKENVNSTIKSSEAVYKLIKQCLDERQETEKHKEYLYIVGLDSQNKVLFVDINSIGTVNKGAVNIREIFRIALIKNASSIILSHNHPSGGVSPSSADTDVTKTVKTLGKVMDVPLLDHVIVGEDKYFSFGDLGLV